MPATIKLPPRRQATPAMTVAAPRQGISKTGIKLGPPRPDRRSANKTGSFKPSTACTLTGGTWCGDRCSRTGSCDSGIKLTPPRPDRRPSRPPPLKLPKNGSSPTRPTTTPQRPAVLKLPKRPR